MGLGNLRYFDGFEIRSRIGYDLKVPVLWAVEAVVEIAVVLSLVVVAT